jgi:hypothetical protein
MQEDELKDFEDYLSEFNSSISFDSETCPVCGINPSENIAATKVPLVEIKFESETIAEKAIIKLEENNIKFKRSTEGNEKILIAEQRLEEVKKILRE